MDVNLFIFHGFLISLANTIKGLQFTVDLRSKVMENINVRQVMEEIKINIENKYYNASPEEKKIYENAVINRLQGEAVLSVATSKLWRVDDIDFTQSAVSKFTQKNGKDETYHVYM